MQSGGGVPIRPGLSRYSLVPAAWLEALLEDEEEDPLKQNHCLTQFLSDTPPPPRSQTSVGLASPSATTSPCDSGFFETDTGFLRQNSSPADFMETRPWIPMGTTRITETSILPLRISTTHPSESVRGNRFPRITPPTNWQFIRNKMEQGSEQDLEMVNFLEGEDSVSFRVRAKRGCATHPRSIAERVRRTRISDRIRKLQELVPNMDKQTNTTDMLDEALDYVKLLQKQIQELSQQQKRCKCIDRDIKEWPV